MPARPNDPRFGEDSKKASRIRNLRKPNPNSFPVRLTFEMIQGIPRGRKALKTPQGAKLPGLNTYLPLSIYTNCICLI
jgi:hypothetical protein